MSGGKTGAGGSDFEHLRTDADPAGLSRIVDGIGPAISGIVSGAPSPASARAHAHGLQVHPYTLRVDDLPKGVSSADELMRLLFVEAKVDGLFTDFPDVTAKWLMNLRAR